MSKEIGKLIELLNEFDNGWDYDDYYGPYQYGQDTDAYKYGKYYLVSRGYGFIKWLVENKKFKRYSAYKNLLDGDYVKFGSNGPVIPSVNGQLYDSILCGLAISDEPIEFLVSILK